MSEEDRFKLSAFLATPYFIKALTDLSLKLSLLKIAKDEKLAILKEEIRKLNKFLPSNVYIPFVSSMIYILF